MSDTPYAVPLVEQLKSVPIDGHDCYPFSDVHHKNIPYGVLCHSAASEIERLREERGTAREALRFIAEWGGRTHKTEYGDIQCNGKWCAEQAKEALR